MEFADAVSGASVSRRAFLRQAGILGAATVLAPQAAAQGLTSQRSAPTLGGGSFAEGVLSGDPAPDAITLWTRVSEVAGNGSVGLEVATDRGFERVVARKLIGTSAELGHHVKARVGRLQPHETYYYRFFTKDSESRVGRFRTALPPDSRAPVRFAFFSCQEYSFGLYNAHQMLREEDVDFVLCLGDYIYEEDYYSPSNGGAGVRNDTVGAAKTLEQYRAKYSLYRSDPALRAMHARFPMISIWDDHEVHDAFAGAAEASDPAAVAQRDAAYRAYFESMPTYQVPPGKGTRIYRAVRFGRSVDLMLLDERQYRDAQPCGDAIIAPPCPELEQDRSFLGSRQLAFFKRRLRNSRAAWKVIANQVMIMDTRVGSSYINFDSWQGYPGERRDLLSHIDRHRIKDVVFVTGDIHTIIAGDVRKEPDARRALAVEFVGGSITSPGLGEEPLAGKYVPVNADNPQVPRSVVDLLLNSNPWVDNADLNHHGYGLVEATPSRFDCTIRRVDTVRRPEYRALSKRPFQYRLHRGQAGLEG